MLETLSAAEMTSVKNNKKLNWSSNLFSFFFFNIIFQEQNLAAYKAIGSPDPRTNYI